MSRSTPTYTVPINHEWTRSFRRGVKALLGDDGYEAFIANDLVVRQSAVVEHMQARLKASGAQLSDEQATQLLSLLKERNGFRVNDNVLQRASDFFPRLRWRY